MEPDKQPSQTGVIDQNLIYLFLITGISILGVSSVTPLLPTLARRFDVPIHLMSLAIICFTLPGIICTPLSGILSDRIGRKQVLMFSLIMSGLSGIGAAFAPTFGLFLVCRFCQGIGSSALGLLNMTVISDVYPDPYRRTKALAYISGAVSISTAGIPVLTGLLAELSIELVLLLPALSLPLSILVWFRMPIRSTPSTTATLREYLVGILNSAAQKDILLVLIMTFGTFSLLFGLMSSFIPILADTRFDASPALIGLIFSVASLGTLTGTVWIARNISVLMPRHVLLTGSLLFAVALGVLPLLPSFFLILIPMFFWGIGQGLNGPILNTIMLSYAPAENRGGLLAVQGTVMRLAQTVGPSVFTMFYMAFGLTTVFEIGAVIALGLVSLVYLYMPQTERITNAVA